MRISKVRRAYGRLLELIEAGDEYPEAHYTVVMEEFALTESQTRALERMYETEPSGRVADTSFTLPQAADLAKQIIAAARADGVTINDGNVIDLLADNIVPPYPLGTLRQLLIVGGMAVEFPRACLPRDAHGKIDGCSDCAPGKL